MTINKKQLDSIIRVNHAGEYGARVIYDGQIAALRLKKDHETLKMVEEMKKHEDEHFDYFNEQIIKQKARPTLMQPLWKAGGFAMGFLTAILDKRAAMACTTAVEEVIDEHYQSQLDFLEKEIGEQKEAGDAKEGDAKFHETGELKQKIEKFRQDELHHRDIGYENGAGDLSYFLPLSKAVKAATRFAIEVSKRV